MRAKALRDEKRGKRERKSAPDRERLFVQRGEHGLMPGLQAEKSMLLGRYGGPARHSPTKKGRRKR